MGRACFLVKVESDGTAEMFCLVEQTVSSLSSSNGLKVDVEMVLLYKLSYFASEGYSAGWHNHGNCLLSQQLEARSFVLQAYLWHCLRVSAQFQ